MHPPFIHTDHRIGQTHQHPKPRTIVRRSKPERLDLTPTVQGWPPMPILEPSLHAKALIAQPPQIYLVPPPRRIWRDILGRFLIRAGQRMLAANGPG